VYVPDGEGIGVSRRLSDSERDRLRGLASKLKLEGGLIIRTSAQGARKIDMERELDYLFKLHEALQNRVKHTGAPAMVFQDAEALTVIDVNTGSYTGRGRGTLEDTITKVNLQATEEVVRQLRLRDIGGIIVIDFIDMSSARNRDQVLTAFRRALEDDRTRTYV